MPCEVDRVSGGSARGRGQEKRVVASGGNSGIDIGINSAGVEEIAMFKKHSPEHFSKITAIQFNGAVHFMQHVSNVMENGGNLVNISSLTGSLAAPGYVAYAGAKAGVIHASKVAAVELGRGPVNTSEALRRQGRSTETP